MANSRLSKKVQEIIKTATTKQKAILVVTNNFDKKQILQKPLLSDEEVRAIKDSLSPSEAKEYNKWIHCYNVYAEIAPLIGLAIAQYREQAEEIVGYLKVVETYAQEENHLNIIFEAIKESGSKKAIDAFDTSLKNLRFNFASLKRDEEGYIEIDTTKLFEQTKEMIKRMGFSYACLKAFIVALDEWTKKNKSKKLMPPVLLSSIESIKDDTAIDVAPIYSRRVLKRRIAQGQTPTATEEKRAIFPCYDDIPEDAEFIQMWRDKINEVELQYKS